MSSEGGSNSVDAKKTDVRPWGSFEILADLPYTKVKRLIVNPGHRFSYQSHRHRDEHWIVVRGVAQVMLDDSTADYKYGDHVFFKRGTKHRLTCISSDPVEIIEVQVGDSFAEDDILRYEDDYGRAR